MQFEETVTATETPVAPAAGESQQKQDMPQAEGQQAPQSESATDKPIESKDEKDSSDKVQRRFNRITRDKYEALARAEALEREVAQLRQLTQVKSDADDGQQGQKQLSPEQTQALIEERARDHAEKLAVRAKLEATKEAASKDFPDFDEVFSGLANAPIRFPSHLASEVMESPAAAAILYHLGNNLDEADALGRMAVDNPFKAARELRKLEERLSKLKTSAAPKPLSPLRGAASDDIDPEKLSDAEWAKRHRQTKKD